MRRSAFAAYLGVTAMLAVVVLSVPSEVAAEPYFAAREGMKCVACHVSPSGGGMRNQFGNIWAQTMLPARRIEVEDVPMWTGALSPYLAVGGNLRANGSYVDIPDEDTQSEFDVEEMRVYGAVTLIHERLLLYVDERIAPGGSVNLEAYARFSSADQRWHVRAGQIYLPYGWRLEDDNAFIRQVTGIGFATPDRGIEIGLETNEWSAQLALTNGTGGGSETDDGKQVSLRAEHIRALWRIGASASYNDAEAGARHMQGAFAAVRTGPIVWLAEADYITDDSFPARRHMWAGLIEANWNYKKGHNLKLTAEYFDPDDDIDEDEQNRYSLVWEYFPVQFLQLRAGARIYDGIPQNAFQNRKIYFVQAHGYF